MSVLRYPGGKSKAIKVLSSFIPADSKEMVSPFCGGLSFELYCANVKGMTVHASDLFEPLIVFWQCLKSDANLVVENITKLLPITKESFLYLRKNELFTHHDVFRRAAIFFVLNRCSFSGLTCSGGFSKESAEKRLTPSSIEKLKTIDLTRIDFTLGSAFDVIKKYPQNNIWLFLDPPYMLAESKSNLYGIEGDLHKKFNHTELNMLLKSRTNWMLCYNESDNIRESYKNHTIHSVNWNYGMSADKKGKELVIVSV